jgi:hypothetical protein
MHSPPRREAEQRIARFGVQRLPRRLFDHNEMASTMTCEGTPDYIAPEMFLVFEVYGEIRRARLRGAGARGGLWLAAKRAPDSTFRIKFFSTGCGRPTKRKIW